MSAIKLTTFRKEKYGEQIVAVHGDDGGFKLALFDACRLFMDEDTWAERQRVKDEAKEFAERLVAEMNDGARYRHLRSKDLETIDRGGVFAGLTPKNVVLNGEDLDVAIDAEIAEAGRG